MSVGGRVPLVALTPPAGDVALNPAAGGLTGADNQKAVGGFLAEAIVSLQWNGTDRGVNPHVLSPPQSLLHGESRGGAGTRKEEIPSLGLDDEELRLSHGQ